MMNKVTPLLLASQSPRRRALIALLGLPFEVASADVDERILPDEDPAEYVLRLAEAKARAFSPPPSQPSPSGGRSQRVEGTILPPEGGARGGRIVIGSDTAVVDAGEILGKPRDAREAESMLRQLCGRTHQVYTAIAVWDETSKKIVKDLSVSDVPMRNYGDDEILTYIQTGDPLDKAGGYAIQHPEFQPVENFEGCFASVMGLPLCRLARILKEMGLVVDENMPRLCQSSLAFECTISSAVLRGENLG